MIYDSYKRNHVVLPGRDKALESFLRQEYKGLKHKFRNGFNSNSEDALTWSCFELIKSLPSHKRFQVLSEIWEDSYDGKLRFPAEMRDLNDDDINIFIGKEYRGSGTDESSEIDASIELPNALIFIEAKLYSSISSKEQPKKPWNQIQRKIRIGLDDPIRDNGHSIKNRDFYFILLDIAPRRRLMLRKSKTEALAKSGNGFHDKWKSAWWFNYYKNGWNGSLKPLRETIKDVSRIDPKEVAGNMGWLTWTDLFKDILRGMTGKESPDVL